MVVDAVRLRGFGSPSSSSGKRPAASTGCAPPPVATARGDDLVVQATAAQEGVFQSLLFAIVYDVTGDLVHKPEQVMPLSIVWS